MPPHPAGVCGLQPNGPLWILVCLHKATILHLSITWQRHELFWSGIPASTSTLCQRKGRARPHHVTPSHDQVMSGWEGPGSGGGGGGPGSGRGGGRGPPWQRWHVHDSIRPSWLRRARPKNLPTWLRPTKGGTGEYARAANHKAQRNSTADKLASSCQQRLCCLRFSSLVPKSFQESWTDWQALTLSTKHLLAYLAKKYAQSKYTQDCRNISVTCFSTHVRNRESKAFDFLLQTQNDNLGFCADLENDAVLSKSGKNNLWGKRNTADIIWCKRLAKKWPKQRWVVLDSHNAKKKKRRVPMWHVHLQPKQDVWFPVSLFPNRSGATGPLWPNSCSLASSSLRTVQLSKILTGLPDRFLLTKWFHPGVRKFMKHFVMNMNTVFEHVLTNRCQWHKIWHLNDYE